MESLSHTPTPVKRSQASDAMAPAQRKPRAGDGLSDPAADAAAVDGFSRLLQAAGMPEAVSSAAAGLAAAMTAPPAETSETTALPSEAADGALALGMLNSDAGWNLQSLVGQTAQLDQSADVMVRNGTHIQARLDAGAPSGLLHSAAQALQDAAAAVPVVAQGVAAAAGSATGMGQAAAMADVGAAAWNAAGDAVQSLADAMADATVAEDGDALSRMDRSTEGRVALQGQWVAADRQPAPAEAMQRLLGQMSQFLSATGATDAAGLRRANGKATDELVAGAAEGAAVSAGTGVGAGMGRLLDSAVAQTAAGQQAGQTGADQTAAEPDMAFWMNARQQKAEVVLDRDGEPVRVQVMMEGNTAHVTFRSDEQATRAMLDASVAQLRDLLASQGVELSGVQVGAEAGGQSQADAQGARGDGFMPEGARRVRLQSGALQEQVAGLPRQIGAARTGVDVFA